MSKLLFPRLTAALLAGLVLVLSLYSARAQTVEQFFSGRQMTLIIGNAAGSGASMPCHAQA